MMRLIHAVLAVLLIAGCADTHTLTRSSGTQAAVSLQRVVPRTSPCRRTDNMRPRSIRGPEP